MPFRKIAATLFVAFVAVLAAEGVSRAESPAELRKQVHEATKGFRDIQADVNIAYSNQTELAKIGKDFGQAYRFKNSRMMFETPNKFKMTARAGLVNVSYIVTGNTKKIRAGIINKTEDISKEPHKRQTILDAGLANDSLWSSYNVEQVSKSAWDKQPALKVQLSLSNSPQKKQYIYLNPKDFRLLAREKREANGSLIARYVYSKFKEYAGVWIPTEIRVYNGAGKLGGTSVYSNIKVNKGIPDSEFK
ncbi:MAG: outer membrane lipoprotein-sorting protein [Armatimonadetes bacterium]|nr:outer membrane lipoprotein-sorting protein [Armatimonadota bacterium]